MSSQIISFFLYRDVRDLMMDCQKGWFDRPEFQVKKNFKTLPHPPPPHFLAIKGTPFFFSLFSIFQIVNGLNVLQPSKFAI